MRVLLITGSSPRHMYLASRLSSAPIELSCLVEKRTLFEQFDAVTPLSLRKLTKKHFDDWNETEKSFFGHMRTYQSLGGEWMLIDKDFLVSNEIVNWIMSYRPDLMLSYGCSKLHDNILDIPWVEKLNIHGGLSPWYRGTITNFWPTYMLEPQFTGMTLHRTTKDIDGGDILLQTSVRVLKEDGVNQISCRAARTFIDTFVDLFSRQPESFIGATASPQKTSGRIWTNKMWTPHHLRPIYEIYENKVNEYCLQNNHVTRTPRLVNLFSTA